MSDDPRLSRLRDYAAGRAGTRDTLEALGFEDYGDLLRALVAAELPFPKPPETPVLQEHRARAWAILEPRLRAHGA